MNSISFVLVKALKIEIWKTQQHNVFLQTMFCLLRIRAWYRKWMSNYLYDQLMMIFSSNLSNVRTCYLYLSYNDSIFDIVWFWTFGQTQQAIWRNLIGLWQMVMGIFNNFLTLYMQKNKSTNPENNLQIVGCGKTQDDSQTFLWKTIYFFCDLDEQRCGLTLQCHQYSTLCHQRNKTVGNVSSMHGQPMQTFNYLIQNIIFVVNCCFSHLMESICSHLTCL